jgi:hypothetical protein
LDKTVAIAPEPCWFRAQSRTKTLTPPRQSVLVEQIARYGPGSKPEFCEVAPQIVFDMRLKRAD